MIPLRGDDIDTDRIIPARYLRCVTFDGLGAHAFEDDRNQNASHPFNQDRFQGASILVVGKNFGCGSSREHAPQSLKRWGINAIIGKSFAEIFFSNCLAMGLPCFTVDDKNGERLFDFAEDDPSVEAYMDIVKSVIRVHGEEISANIPSGTQKSLTEGSWNATAVLLEAEVETQKLAASLPYLNNFSA